MEKFDDNSEYNFDNLNNFLRRLRKESVEREKNMSEPIFFEIKMNIPMDIGLVMSSILYTRIFRN